ncbi:hypothetical protein [Campylobacter ureolyticus]|uniref:hypothetical protein n=1 Tax=Campylobacter ureolyticus TaxID=827 RepID=UPI0022B478BF|nr:hypothetical protein [Campylobacter ureolyticus]MCZ6110887.1 hypothetical protein [Campylobacter ureolyticus]MDK8323775.1 hypothetical protein [Campylobacter ureolyticus]
MTIITPTKFTHISNTFIDENLPKFSLEVTYNTGDEVIYKNNIYKCVKDGVTNLSPVKSPKEWVLMGATNKYKFMDKYITSQSKSDETVEILIKVDESIDTISLFNLNAARCEIIGLDNDENIKFTKEINLTYKKSRSWWEYFFGKFYYKADAIINLDQPFYGNIKIKLYKNKFGASLGHLLVGSKYHLGATIYSPKIGILDYSKVVANDFGDKELFKGKNAKYADLGVAIKNINVDEVRKKLSEVAGTLALFIGDERDYGFDSLNIYGFYKDFNILIDSGGMNEYSICQISIEGVV